MRPKIVLSVMVLAALVLAAAFYFRPQTASETAAVPPPAVNPVSAAAPVSASNPMPQPVAVIAPHPAKTMTPEQKQAYIYGEISRLQDLSTKRDPASLSAILDDLTNSEKEIRLAAIEAVKQVGNRDAIPVLKADVANTPDTDEQIALLQAANFLSLPTLADSDVQVPLTPAQLQAAQQQQALDAARRQARLQAQLQQLPQNQNSQAAPQ